MTWFLVSALRLVVEATDKTGQRCMWLQLSLFAIFSLQRRLRRPETLLLFGAWGLAALWFVRTHERSVFWKQFSAAQPSEVWLRFSSLLLPLLCLFSIRDQVLVWRTPFLWVQISGRARSSALRFGEAFGACMFCQLHVLLCLLIALALSWRSLGNISIAFWGGWALLLVGQSMATVLLVAWENLRQSSGLTILLRGLLFWAFSMALFWVEWLPISESSFLLPLPQGAELLVWPIAAVLLLLVARAPREREKNVSSLVSELQAVLPRKQLSALVCTEVETRQNVLSELAQALSSHTSVGIQAPMGVLFSEATARQFLQFYARLTRPTQKNWRKEVETLCVALAISPDVPIERLPQSQRSTLSLALALVGHPAVILLDSSSDVEKARHLLRSYAAESTLLIGVSKLSGAEGLCRDVFLVHQHKLVRRETLASLRGATAELSFSLPTCPREALLQALQTSSRVCSLYWSEAEKTLWVGTLQEDEDDLREEILAFLAKKLSA